ncbi:MAG: hypothetical protein WDW38_006121 [Sanguina aurantia]
MHRKAITGLDWSFDSSQVLTAGEDGAICLFDAATGICLRSIIDFHVHKAITCCRDLELPTEPVHAAVECDNHAVYVGDSHGSLHMFRSHMSGTSLTRLVWTCKIKACSNKRSPLLRIQTLPFCRALDAPGLVTFCLDSTLSVIKAGDVSISFRRSRVRWSSSTSLTSATSSCTASASCRPPPPLHPAICPLSLVTQPLPLVTCGAEDSNVYIYDMAQAGGKVGTLTTLRGHAAPVTDVAWSFDEQRLASASTDGTVILWKRGA